MNEQQRMLADTVERLFPGIAAEQRGHGARGDFTGAWERVRELGIADVLVPEEAGGFGGNWQDAAVVMHACGRHALPLPVGETLVARKLLCGTDIAAPPGAAISMAACAGATRRAGRRDAAPARRAVGRGRGVRADGFRARGYGIPRAVRHRGRVAAARAR